MAELLPVVFRKVKLAYQKLVRGRGRTEDRDPESLDDLRYIPRFELGAHLPLHDGCADDPLPEYFPICRFCPAGVRVHPYDIGRPEVLDELGRDYVGKGVRLDMAKHLRVAGGA